MRGLRGWLAWLCLCGLAACSDSVVAPSIDWPAATEIAQDRLSDRCVVVDGGVKCWAELGKPESISTEVDRVVFQRDTWRPGPPLPVIDVGNESEVVAFDGAGYVRCAVLGSGGVKCWGRNDFFKLALPDPLDYIGQNESERGENMPVMNLGTGVQAEQIEVRGGGSCVRFRDGRVKCWGTADADLGLGDLETHGDDPDEMGDNLPFVDLGSDVRAVGLGGSYAHTCIWTAEGRVKCWGANSRGQLGVASPDGEPLGDGPDEMGDALPFVDLGSDVHVVQVSPGPEHTCALTDEGRIKCWGGNWSIEEDDPHLPGPEPEPYAFGRLGLGDADDRSAPLGDALPYVDLGEEFRAVAVVARRWSTCAVSDAGRLKCWGAGTLGDGKVSYGVGDEPGEMGDSLPDVDLGQGRTVQRVDQDSCVMLDDDSVRCWDDATNAKLVGDAVVPDVTHEDLFEPE